MSRLLASSASSNMRHGPGVILSWVCVESVASDTELSLLGLIRLLLRRTRRRKHPAFPGCSQTVDLAELYRVRERESQAVVGYRHARAAQGSHRRMLSGLVRTAGPHRVAWHYLRREARPRAHTARQHRDQVADLHGVGKGRCRAVALAAGRQRQLSLAHGLGRESEGLQDVVPFHIRIQRNDLVDCRPIGQEHQDYGYVF